MECIQKSQAVIVDGDDTLWEGKVATAMGKAYIVREALHFHPSAVISGLKGALRISRIAKNGLEGEVAGMQEFYKIMIDEKIGREDEMYMYARRHMEKHTINVVSGLLHQVAEGTPIILATADGSTAAEAAKDHFMIGYSVFNIDLFSCGRLVGVKIVIRKGSDKLLAVTDALETLDARIEKRTAIGDSAGDIPLLKAAGYRIASPLASEQVRGIGGIVQLRA